ncbi:amino acid adenylation domain-containing protein [Kitasatospora sp. Ki12]
MTGELDVDALGAALLDVVGRHEVLRTVFEVADGEPHQRVLPVAESGFALQAAVVPDAELPVAVAGAAGHVFDLTSEIPIRAALFTTSSGEHTLVVVAHHIATDGWSTGPPAARDLSAAYTPGSRDRRPSGRPCRCSTRTTRFGSASCWVLRMIPRASFRSNSPTGERR